MSGQCKIRRAIIGVMCLISLAPLILFTPSAASGDPDTTHEYRVKAAFLYNFVRFTEWPQAAFKSPTDPICIAVIGRNNMGDAFTPFLNKRINGRNIVVVYKKETEPLDCCHVVFFTRCEDPIQDHPLSKLAKTSVLTVGENPGFARMGGMINFVLEDQKIRFEINPGAAEKAGLKISSKLLHLATIIQEEDLKP